MSKTQKPNINAIRKALARYGIYTEGDLDEAISKMKKVNIGCMVSPIGKKKEMEAIEWK